MQSKVVPWANGQFGFGVHAARAFAKNILFVSRKKDCEGAQIIIDRDTPETKDVSCTKSKRKELAKEHGTYVEIYRFDRGVFKKRKMKLNLIKEIETHFDDVIRNNTISIYVTQNGKDKYKCKFFNYDNLKGTPFVVKEKIKSKGKEYLVDIDTKVLEKPYPERSVMLLNKGRRIADVIDLKSYKRFAHENGKSNVVWGNPFLVGRIEINELCSPNLTRDDLKESVGRRQLYEKLLEFQEKIEEEINVSLSKKAQKAYVRLGELMTDYLSDILRDFKLEYDTLTPTIAPQKEKDGESEEGELDKETKETREKGDTHGAVEPKDTDITRRGRNQVEGEGTKESGDETEQILKKSTGPQILFQRHADADRVIDLGNSLVVNTVHPDFIERNKGKEGLIRLDSRLINYVSVVIAPYCIQRIFEKKGLVPTPLEAGVEIINLSTQLEKHLNENALSLEMELNE